MDSAVNSETAILGTPGTQVLWTKTKGSGQGTDSSQPEGVKHHCKAARQLPLLLSLKNQIGSAVARQHHNIAQIIRCAFLSLPCADPLEAKRAPQKRPDHGIAV